MLIHFSANEYVSGDNLLERFGIRGRNFLNLARMDVPISPGFLVESSVVSSGDFDKRLTKDMLVQSVAHLEKQTQRKFGGGEGSPMILKAIVSPSIQVGTVHSVHAIGLNDESVKSFAVLCGEDFAYQEYAHLLETFSVRFQGGNAQSFTDLREKHSGAGNKVLCEAFRGGIAKGFPQDCYEQLQIVLTSLCRDYLGDPMNEDIEASLLVQVLAYGNAGQQSYNGSIYSRDVVTGESKLTGFYGENEFDTLKEKSKPIESLEKSYLDQLGVISGKLEDASHDIIHIKFTIQQGTLWVIEQNSVTQKSTQAEIRLLLDLYKQKKIDKNVLTEAVPSKQVQDLLYPVIDHSSTAKMASVTGGLAGSPGAAVGRVCYSTPTLLSEYRRAVRRGEDARFILVMPHTVAEDVEAIEIGVATVASVGGYSSHAPVVSRSLRKPCVLYESIEYHDGYALIGGNKVNELDYISMEVPTYTDPTMWFGTAEMKHPDTSKNGLEEYLVSVDTPDNPMRVLTTIQSKQDIKPAEDLGGDSVWVGADDLLNSDEVIDLFQDMVLLPVDSEKQNDAQEAFAKVFKKKVLGVLNSVKSDSMIIQLLDGPLNIFMPVLSRDEIIERIYKSYPSENLDKIKSRFDEVRSVTELLGKRGTRLAVTHPDIYQVHIVSILEAAFDASVKNPNLTLNIAVPGVMTDADLRFVRNGRNIESMVINGISGMRDEIMKQKGLSEMPFTLKIGAVIDYPATAFASGHLAKQSDFILINVENLTQCTMGISVRDLNNIFPAFNQYDILRENPFEVLSKPVEELIRTAVHYGRMIRPGLEVGIMVKHISNIDVVNFALQVQADYLITEIYSVPVAKIAMLQEVVQKNKKNAA